MPQHTPTPDAIREAISTLYLMHERLELNNYAGEEAPFMHDCMVAIAMLEGREPPVWEGEDK